MGLSAVAIRIRKVRGSGLPNACVVTQAGRQAVTGLSLSSGETLQLTAVSFREQLNWLNFAPFVSRCALPTSAEVPRAVVIVSHFVGPSLGHTVLRV